MKDVAYWRILLFLLGVAGGVVAILYLPNIKTESIPALITIFSVFSGVLIAAITLVGNSISLLGRNDWKVLQNYKATFSAKIFRLTLVSYFQIVTLVVLCGALIFENVLLLSEIAVGVSTFTFIISLSIPYAIADIYKEYYEFVIEAGREKDKKKSEASSA